MSWTRRRSVRIRLPHRLRFGCVVNRTPSTQLLHRAAYRWRRCDDGEAIDRRSSVLRIAKMLMNDRRAPFDRSVEQSVDVTLSASCHQQREVWSGDFWSKLNQQYAIGLQLARQHNREFIRHVVQDSKIIAEVVFFESLFRNVESYFHALFRSRVAIYCWSFDKWRHLSVSVLIRWNPCS